MKSLSKATENVLDNEIVRKRVNSSITSQVPKNAKKGNPIKVNIFSLINIRGEGGGGESSEGDIHVCMYCTYAHNNIILYIIREYKGSEVHTCVQMYCHTVFGPYTYFCQYINS